MKNFDPERLKVLLAQPELKLHEQAELAKLLEQQPRQPAPSESPKEAELREAALAIEAGQKQLAENHQKLAAREAALDVREKNLAEREAALAAAAGSPAAAPAAAPANSPVQGESPTPSPAPAAPAKPAGKR